MKTVLIALLACFASQLRASDAVLSESIAPLVSTSGETVLEQESRKKWNRYPIATRKRIQELLLSFGLSSTGTIQLAGVYAESDASESMLLFKQADLMGTRIFWIVLVRPSDQSYRLIYHLDESRISDKWISRN